MFGHKYENEALWAWTDGWWSNKALANGAAEVMENVE